MQIAICNETFDGWPLERVCSFARSLGYEGLELAPYTLADNLHALSERDCASIRATVEGSGLTTVGLHWLLAKTTGLHLTSPDPAVRARTADYLAELARRCHDVGGQVLVLGSPQQRRLLPGVTREHGLDYGAEVIRSVIPVLEDTHVVLAIEPLAPHECNLLGSAKDAVEWIDRIAHPNVQLHLDAKAMSYESIPIPEIIARYAGRLAHFHANDPNLLGPGMGDLDFHPILAALRDANYSGWISVEVFDPGPGPEEIARRSIEYLKGIGDLWSGE